MTHEFDLGELFREKRERMIKNMIRYFDHDLVYELTIAPTIPKNIRGDMKDLWDRELPS